MFLNRGISTSIKNYSEQIDRLKSAMKEADAVIAVSYTHLDVYKRQIIMWPVRSICLKR